MAMATATAPATGPARLATATADPAGGAAAEKTVLVVDDMPIFREPIAASLRHGGYRAVCAADGHEALAALGAHRPAVVLLDVAMPGMDGISVLRAIRADAALAHTPVILLTAIAEKKFVIEAGKLGVHDYLLKSRFSLGELLARVAKYVTPAGNGGPNGAAEARPTGTDTDREYLTRPAAKPGFPLQTSASSVESRGVERQQRAHPSPDPDAAGPAAESVPAAHPDRHAPRLLPRQHSLARAEKALQAKTLSGAVAQVLSLATSARGNAADLAALVARDPVLSARVLQAANSAAYATGRAVVSTVADAVRHVGSSAVRNIALGVGVFDMMPAPGPDGFNPIRCWQHSFAVASLCEALAQSGVAAAASPAGHGAPDVNPGVAYLVGLCHDLGEVLFHTHFGHEYRQVLEAQRQTGRPRAELERQMLGVCRGELVGVILGRLGLPDAVREPIQQFHDRCGGGGAGRVAGAPPLTRLLRLADAYANGMGLASGAGVAVECLTRAECRAAAGQENPARPDAAAFRANVLGLTGLLARLSAKEQAELMSPLLERRPVRLWVARDPALSGFDPVGAALDALAETEVHDRLPAGPAELAPVQGLVVLARGDAVPGWGAGDVRQAGRGEAGQALPVLWLVARADEAPPAATVGPAGAEKPVPTRWPVPLQTVADFVTGLRP